MKLIVWFERTDRALSGDNFNDPTFAYYQHGLFNGWRLCVRKLPDNAQALELEDNPK